MQAKKNKREKLLFEEQQNVKMMHGIAVNDLRSIIMDLTYLAALPTLHQMIELDKSTDCIKLSGIFVNFCKFRALYDQIRFLDENGMEMIRVNFNQGHPGIVPYDQLQNKAKRYYFADTIRLEPGQIFVSPLDLNIEHGQIEQPLKPMIRFGTPLVDLKGRKQGIVLLNYFGSEMIRHLHEASAETVGKFMLLNSQGYWLKGLDSEDEWGFMYDDRKKRTLAITDPLAWEKIVMQKSGQFRNNHGIYTFDTIWPIVHGMTSSTGSEKPFNASEKTFSDDEYYWKVASFIPIGILDVQFALIQSRWMIAYALAGIFSGLFSWLLASNIVRRKQAEITSIEKAMYLSNILNSSTEYAIATTDLDLCITYYNPMAEKLFGYTAAEVIGKKVQDIHTKEKVRPARFEQAIRLVRTTGKYIYTLVKESDQGTRHILSQVTGIYADDGELVGFALFSKDETERLATEAALQKSEKQYSTLFENMTDVFYRLDQNGTILEISPSALKLYNYDSIDKMIGKHANDFVYNIEDNKIFVKELQRKGSITNYIIKHKQKDGAPLFVETNTKIIFDKDGNPDGVVGVFRDITERRQAEEVRDRLQTQLQQAQKMEAIGALAGGIAHDFNNILFSIFGYLEIALDDIPGDTPLRSHLEEVLKGAKRARDLVKQILTFSRQSEHELKPLKTQRVIQEALKLIKSSLPSTIEIRDNINNDCGLVMADPTQIHQVVMNLCTNAYHAMEKTGGKLTVNLKELALAAEDLEDPGMIPGQYVCLTVADTGPGMEKHIIDRIFDPYFTTKEKGKGTGLGLAIVHGIIKNHGAQINVYSELGKGTEFQICFPVIKKQEETAQVENDTPIQKGDERILLVDDQDIIVQIEKQMLERMGYDVTARTSSIEALEAFKENPDQFDLVITDLTMPNMTGDKLAVEIMKIRSDTPVILCTGFSEMMSREKAESMGIKGFLMKPVVMKDFSSMIRKVLDKE